MNQSDEAFVQESDFGAGGLSTSVMSEKGEQHTCNIKMQLKECIAGDYTMIFISHCVFYACTSCAFHVHCRFYRC